MKKLFLLSIIMSVAVTTSFAQQLYLEVFSGYNKTAYDDTLLKPNVGYIPIGGRIGGGFEHVQLGVEYSRDITHPAFKTKVANVEVAKQELVNDYTGLFVRANLSTLPAYRFGFIIMAGAGYYNTKVNNYVLQPSESLVNTKSYDRTLGYNARVGISAPIYAQLHWEFGYQFNYLERKAKDGLPGYQALYHSFQGGLSLNLVFGNTAKACRRVIETEGGYW